MKLTSLTGAGGDPYHSPASHIVDIDGHRILLECPFDLSTLVAFAPLDRATTGLISAVPRYKSPAAAMALRLCGIDAVLISSPSAMAAVPLLTRCPSFARVKIFATEVAVRIGRLMMDELVEMHAEFVKFYGTDDLERYPDWMKKEALEGFAPSVQKVIAGEEGDELSSWMPIYSSLEVKECMEKVTPLKYREEICYNGALMLKAFSSGLELGSCNWTIRSPRWNVAYLSSSIIMSAHALGFDSSYLCGNDLVLFSDFSTFHSTEDDRESSNNIEETMETDETDGAFTSVPRSNNESDLIEILHHDDGSIEEMGKITYICSCMVESLKEGGSVLIPTGRLGVTLLLLEHISEKLALSGLKIPIFIISATGEETLTSVNTIPEWVCNARQEKFFAGEALFGHAKLLDNKRLKVFPTLYSKDFLATWQEPCIVFSPHWSLRLGSVVHLLNRWHADRRCLLVLEDTVDAEMALSPFKPVEMKVLQCSFLSGVTKDKIYPLMELIKPKVVLFPELLRTKLPEKQNHPWSFLNYRKGRTIDVSNPREDVEARLATALAFRLQPKVLPEKNAAVASLRARLLLSNGKYVLVQPRTPRTHSAAPVLQWGTVDADRLLAALRERGICGTVSRDAAPGGDGFTVLVTAPEDAQIRASRDETVIQCKDEKLAKLICDAASSLCDGI